MGRGRRRSTRRRRHKHVTFVLTLRVHDRTSVRHSFCSSDGFARCTSSLGVTQSLTYVAWPSKLHAHAVSAGSRAHACAELHCLLNDVCAALIAHSSFRADKQMLLNLPADSANTSRSCVQIYVHSLRVCRCAPSVLATVKRCLLDA
eukprot:4093052-Pleurochrysis_carterae.AAC.1